VGGCLDGARVAAVTQLRHGEAAEDFEVLALL